MHASRLTSTLCGLTALTLILGASHASAQSATDTPAPKASTAKAVTAKPASVKPAVAATAAKPITATSTAKPAASIAAKPKTATTATPAGTTPKPVTIVKPTVSAAPTTKPVTTPVDVPVTPAVSDVPLTPEQAKIATATQIVNNMHMVHVLAVNTEHAILSAPEVASMTEENKASLHEFLRQEMVKRTPLLTREMAEANAAKFEAPDLDKVLKISKIKYFQDLIQSNFDTSLPTPDPATMTDEDHATYDALNGDPQVVQFLTHFDTSTATPDVKIAARTAVQRYNAKLQGLTDKSAPGTKTPAAKAPAKAPATGAASPVKTRPAQ